MVSDFVQRAGHNLNQVWYDEREKSGSHRSGRRRQQTKWPVAMYVFSHATLFLGFVTQWLQALPEMQVQV